MKIKRSLMKYRGDRCLNCDYPLEISDRYCPRCGQMNSTKKLTFDDFFSEFFSGLFAYDSRLHRTLRALLFKPGKISKDYIQGKRMRYANPFRFYLSASIIFFLIWSFLNPLEFDTQAFDNVAPEVAYISQDSIQKLQPRLDKIATEEEVPAFLDSLKLAAEKKQKRTYKDVYITEAHLDTLGFFEKEYKKLDIFSRFNKETLIMNANTAMDSLKYSQTGINHWTYKKAADWNAIKSNPNIFFNYFLSKLPFIIFFYLPVFAVFIWLLYIRRAFSYMEHLIFTFHVQTTFFILFALAVFIDFFLKGDWGTIIATTIFAYYLYKAMRNFYRQGRVKTIVKFTLLNLLFFILAIVAGIISIFASFAIY
ncbi:DUF3667 domain-containing protein [Salegentibacter chungangensis]|uniref:DUF3667 domain-containing protein n=1 Tax=Salegentibacter chungangensis TaxID=1335724 RepID=A0ABW3NN30_9FLAO